MPRSKKPKAGFTKEEIKAFKDAKSKNAKDKTAKDFLGKFGIVSPSELPRVM